MATVPKFFSAAADIAAENDAYFPSHSGLSVSTSRCVPEQDAQPLGNESCQLSDLPNSQDIEDMLLGDLPVSDLDLDSMMDELESMQPGLGEICYPQKKVVRSESRSSEQVYSMDSLHSSDSLHQLPSWREGSPGASSRQLEEGAEFKARPSCPCDTLAVSPPRRTVSKRRKVQEEDQDGQIADRYDFLSSKAHFEGCCRSMSTYWDSVG